MQFGGPYLSLVKSFIRFIRYSGSSTYQYSMDGFLESKTTGLDITEYSYSSRGELLSVTLPDTTLIEYVHDPMGRRIAKKVNGIITEKYLWQGLTRLLAVYDGSDNLVMRFEYADGRMPVAVSANSVSYYLTYDQVGSLRLVADSAGNVVKQIEYDTFGNILSDTFITGNVPAFLVFSGIGVGAEILNTAILKLLIILKMGLNNWTRSLLLLIFSQKS